MKKIQWKPLLVSLAISLGTGGISTLLTSDNMNTNGELYRPPLAPPGWLFPIVWTILFILMGIAAYLVYISDAKEEEKQTALIIYGVQLLFNAGWSIIFFNLQAYLLAFAWLVLLWYLILRTIVHFSKINKTAARLLYPYLAWVTFAGYLNLAIALYYA